MPGFTDGIQTSLILHVTNHQIIQKNPHVQQVVGLVIAVDLLYLPTAVYTVQKSQ